MTKLCTIENCGKKHQAKGYCSMHYYRWRRHGSAEIGRRDRGEYNNHYKHGMTHSVEYRTWQHVKTRCFNLNTYNFHNYGGRGITMCDEWKNSFERFYEDMGTRPEGYSIDRIDPDGNYEPGNCRWADRTTQSRNRRNCKLRKS